MNDIDYDKLVCYFVISCKKNEHLHKNFTNKNEFIIDDMVAEFMKEDSVKPNNFVGKLDEFVATFNQEFRKLL